MALASSYQPPLFPIEPSEKACSACGRLLPLAAFYARRSGRDGLTAQCKECIKERARAWHWQHRAQSNANSAAYYVANRERLQAAAREYDHARRAEQRARYAANREQERAAQRAYREANHERIRAYQRAYYAEHRATINAWRRTWVRANPEKVNANNRRAYHRKADKTKHRLRGIRRRARELDAEGNFTIDDVRALYAAQHGLCAYCYVVLGDIFHVEHKTPLSRGGSNWPENLALACPRCNFSKHDKTDGEYRAVLASRMPSS